MRCKNCGHLFSKVVDSRQSEDGLSIRRRRECEKCGSRFTTYEKMETLPITVIKKSGGRELFDIEKVKAGIVKAAAKRPISREQLEKLFEKIERDVAFHGDEITSDAIGDLVMDGLKEIDDVAYVRYAAVHRQFKDINSWLSEINDILKNKKDRDK